LLSPPTISAPSELRVEVLGDEIIVILPATSYGVTYSKPGRNQYVEAREGIAR
jgi:hypothetical protein